MIVAAAHSRLQSGIAFERLSGLEVDQPSAL
jgi:hypothetical protein